MGRSNNSNKGLMIYDAFSMALCFIFASLFVFGSGYSGFANLFGIEVSIGNILVFVALLALWHFVLSSMRVYDTNQIAFMFFHQTSETLRLLKATTLGTVAILSLSLLCGLPVVNAMFVFHSGLAYPG